MLNGTKPASQPRTLRTIAQDNAASGSFAKSEVPEHVKPPPYRDTNEPAPVTNGMPISNAATPRPFRVTGGR